MKFIAPDRFDPGTLSGASGLCRPEVTRRVENGFDDADADGVVAETFICFAFPRPGANPFVQDGKYFRLGDVFFVKARDACADAVAAREEVVASDGFADEANFRQHRPTAAVWAAGHAQHDVFVRHAVFGHDGIHLVNEAWDEAFGFGHGERAGWQRDAGHAVFPLFGNGVADEPVLARQFFDFGFVFRCHTRDDEVLVGGEAEVAFVDFGDFAHPGFQRFVFGVDEAAVFNVEGEVPVAFFAFDPADAVATGREVVGADGLEFDAHAFFDFGFEDVHADAFEGVAGARVFAVASVAPVALGADHGFCAVQGVTERDVAKFVGGVGVGGGVAVFAGQTATDEDVEADKVAVFFDGDEAEVVRVDVHFVVGRDDDGGFEFAWQVVFAEDGFDAVRDFFVERLCRFGGEDFFAVQPDVGVSGGARQQVHADFFRPFVGFFVQGAFDGVGGAEDVTVYVACGRDGIEPQFVQPLVHGLDVGF